MAPSEDDLPVNSNTKTRSAQQPAPDDTASHSVDDSRVIQAVQEFRDALQRGESPDRRQIVAKYPAVAAELDACLEGLEFVHVAAPELQDSSSYASRCEHPVPCRTLGDYELLEEVARGGMGIVYKARQLSLNRIVALKMILGGNLAGDDDVQRFRSEAEAAASLRHPNIVAVHEVGVHSGQHYFSMDFIEGRSLAAIVREHSVPARKSAEYVAAIADAVDYAHRRGILHRDLKPSNILIDLEDQVHVTDFGLALRVAGDSDLTRTGQVLGTPAYMSPEQAEGQRALIGPGSDVYSLGVVLYELLTGRPPFKAESPLETMHQVIHAEPASPRLLNPNVPRDLETICLKCLRKRPGDRYGTAGALRQDLINYLCGLPIMARPITFVGRAWRWCLRHPATITWIGGLITGLLLLVPLSTSWFTASTLSEPLHNDQPPIVPLPLDRSDDSATNDQNPVTRVFRFDPGLTSADAIVRSAEWKRELQGYTEELRRDPAAPGPRILRAYTFVNLGRWREAREDFDIFVQDRTDNQELAFEYAAVLIMAGDTEAYRQLCTGILDHPDVRRDTGNARTKYLAARICALAPDSVPEPSRLVELAQQADAADPGRAWYLHTLGLAQYRADRLDDALLSVEASLAAEPAWEANVNNWLLAALIHKRMGHADEARQWAETAAEWCRSVNRGALPAPGLHVHDRWACLLLQREVEELWGSRPSDSQAAADADATRQRDPEATSEPPRP